MNKESILGLIRHLFTFGGGALVTKGLADEAEMQQLIGALITVIGAVWSVIQKRNTKLKVPVALFLACLLPASIVLMGCQSAPPTGQIGVGVNPDGSLSNVTGGITWSPGTNVDVSVGGQLNPATGEWSGNLLITFKRLPDAETVQLALQAKAELLPAKGSIYLYKLPYNSANRDHRIFIQRAMARGALISGMK
jgi:hypothetical protein